MSDSTKLSLTWFLYFAAVGVYFPFFSLYLRENAGLSGTELGLVLAAWPLIGAIAQPLWGQLADRSGARTIVLALVCTGSGIGFIFFGQVSGFVGLLFASAMVAAFGTSIVPLLFSVTLAALRDAGPNAFGRTRVWGTVSFFATVVTFPWLLGMYEKRAGIEAVAGGPAHPALGLMFPVIAAFSLAAAVSAWRLRRTSALSVSAERREWRQLLYHPPMRRLLLFNLLAYTFVQGPMMLFPIYVVARGGSLETVSQMWVIMLLLEVPLVAYAGAGLRRLGARGFMQIGVLAAGFRWAVCGAVDDMTVIFAVQVLHAVVVAGLMLGAPLYLEAIVPERLRSTGQSLLSVMSIGIGGTLSTIGSGALLHAYGPDAPFLVGGIGAIVLGLAATILLPRPGRLVLERDRKLGAAAHTLDQS